MAVSNDCTYAGVSRVFYLIYTYRFWLSIGTCSFPCDNSHPNNDVTKYLKNYSHGSNLFSVDNTFIFNIITFKLIIVRSCFFYLSFHSQL